MTTHRKGEDLVELNLPAHGQSLLPTLGKPVMTINGKPFEPWIKSIRTESTAGEFTTVTVQFYGDVVGNVATKSIEFEEISKTSAGGEGEKWPLPMHDGVSQSQFLQWTGMTLADAHRVLADIEREERDASDEITVKIKAEVDWSSFPVFMDDAAVARAAIKLYETDWALRYGPNTTPVSWRRTPWPIQQAYKRQARQVLGAAFDFPTSNL